MNKQAAYELGVRQALLDAGILIKEAGFRTFSNPLWQLAERQSEKALKTTAKGLENEVGENAVPLAREIPQEVPAGYQRFSKHKGRVWWEDLKERAAPPVAK